MWKHICKIKYLLSLLSIVSYKKNSIWNWWAQFKFISIWVWDRPIIRSLADADKNWSKHRGRFISVAKNEFCKDFFNVSWIYDIDYKASGISTNKTVFGQLVCVQTIEEWPNIESILILNCLWKMTNQIEIWIKFITNLSFTEVREISLIDRNTNAELGQNEDSFKISRWKLKHKDLSQKI